MKQDKLQLWLQQEQRCAETGKKGHDDQHFAEYSAEQRQGYI